MPVYGHIINDISGRFASNESRQMIGGTGIGLAPGKFRINTVTIKESARIGDTVISLVIQTYRQHINIGAKLDVLDYLEFDRYQVICRSLLSERVYEENLVRGREMTMETAIEFALE